MKVTTCIAEKKIVTYAIKKGHATKFYIEMSKRPNLGKEIILKEKYEIWNQFLKLINNMIRNNKTYQKIA